MHTSAAVIPIPELDGSDGVQRNHDEPLSTN